MSTFSFSRSIALTAVAFLILLAGMASAADTDIVRGRVVKIDPTAKQITVEPTTGADLPLAVTGSSNLEVGGKPATLAQFKEGQRVRVTYAEKAGTKEVVLLKPAVVTDEDLGRKVKQTLSTAKDYTFQQKEKYESDVRGVIDDLDDRIDHLEAEAKNAQAGAKDKLQARIAEMKAKRGPLNDRLAKVKSATADAWGDIKSGIGATGDDLQKMMGKLFKE